VFIKEIKFNGQVIKEQYHDTDKDDIWWMITFDKDSNKHVLYKNKKQVGVGSIPELQSKMYK
jgi:hypothetical protein